MPCRYLKILLASGEIVTKKKWLEGNGEHMKWQVEFKRELKTGGQL